MKRPSISSTASRLLRKTSRHIVGSDAAMRVKSRKPPAENFITSDCVTVSRSRRGADDVVGDEMRHVAGDGEHQIVVLRRHHLDIGAEPAPEVAASARPPSGRCPAAASGCTSDCRTARRNRRRARNIPCRRRDAPARNEPPSADAAETCATTDALTEPTSETMAPGFSAGAIAFAASPEAPTGMQRMTQSASRAASAGSAW